MNDGQFEVNSATAKSCAWWQRRFQMIAEVGADSNSTTVLMIPSDFVTLSISLSDYLRERSAGSATPKT